MTANIIYRNCAPCAKQQDKSNNKQDSGQLPDAGGLIQRIHIQEGPGLWRC